MATTKFDVQFSGVAAALAATEDEAQRAAGRRQALPLACTPSRRTAPAPRVGVGVMQAGTGRNVVPSSALLKVETRGESEAINQYVFERSAAH